MWFDHHERDRKPALTEAEHARIQDAIEVREWALQRYPQGAAVDSGYVSREEAAEQTRSLMAAGESVIFGATFIAEGRIVRCDVIQRTADGWAVDQIKASTFEEGKKKVKPEHVLDAAYQVAVMRSAGVPVVGGFLVLLDRKYLWDGGEHDLHRLFVRVDISADVLALCDTVDQQARRFAEAIGQSEIPKVPLDTHCKKCDYADRCLRDVHPHDLIFMPQARKSQIDRWRAAGYDSILDLPETEVSDLRMRPGLRAMKTGKPWISDGLGPALDQIVFPAAFIDFESCATAVPAYPGTVPYEQVCFQWSVHLVDSPEGVVEHREYLHRDGTDPRPGFCQTLWEAVQSARTLVTYSTFEKAQLRKMAEAKIPDAQELADLVDGHSVDLEKVVAENICLPEFKSRTSIKSVLPALVPTMSYEDLAIADGSSAMIGFRKMIDAGTPPEEAERIENDLCVYCRQDTLAMVEIYRALRSRTA